jgi:hypothetical protein
MGSKTFDLMASVTASTKRPPAFSGGKRGAAATNISSMKCTPLDPVDSEIRERLGLMGPMELLQTFCDDGLDIIEGDILVVSGTEYPIRSVADWYWSADAANYLHLVVEELK